MQRVWFLCLWFLCMIAAPGTLAQNKSSELLRSNLEDESIGISVDKPVYLPGDTVRLRVRREDSVSSASVTPIVAIEGMRLWHGTRDYYSGVIPQTVTPGSYPILLRIIDDDGRRYVYETGRVVEVEELQSVEHLQTFVDIAPRGGSTEPTKALTLNRNEIRDLEVVFLRDSIREQMGPQFVTIRTMIHSRGGTTTEINERRVVTFRSHGNPERDRAMFRLYRTAYGPYAAISERELDRVRLPLDSLPSWALVSVTIETDYSIKIGVFNRANLMRRYFRVRGPTIETGFSLGIPKVLYDSRSNDTILYGNTSAMIRFYHVSSESGLRFPVSVGVGTFGVNSPIDVGIGRGGFALSLFLDLVELSRVFEIEIIRKINLGIEATPFFSPGKKGRMLLDAQVSFSL